jgi:hypothetical protein
MPDDLNAQLKRDFPETRLTHEPILPRSGFPPLAKHSEINGGGVKLRDGLTVLDHARRNLGEAIEHIDAAQRLLSETGGQL